MENFSTILGINFFSGILKRMQVLNMGCSGLVGRALDSGPLDPGSVPDPAKGPSCTLMVAGAR